jgi:hypothetical protein
MRSFFDRRPSPAMAVAFVALLAALSGTAVALPGTNTVDSGDIKNGQVKNKDIRKNAVTGKKVKNSSLGGADVKNNSLTGADVNESTLGQVPSANSANSANTANSATTAGFAQNAGAVNGTGVRRLAVDIGPNSSTTALSQNGLILTLACDAFGLGTLTATTSVNDSDLYFWGYDTDNAVGSAAGISGSDLEDEGFDVGDTVDISNLVGDSDSDTAMGDIDYWHPGGISGGLTVHYVLNSFNGGSSDHCQLSGSAIG